MHRHVGVDEEQKICLGRLGTEVARTGRAKGGCRRYDMNTGVPGDLRRASLEASSTTMISPASMPAARNASRHWRNVAAALRAGTIVAMLGFARPVPATSIGM
jgi:hypothetical protein